jgi:threonylcarbamoyladenosine tRNA methylthiotransferase MtaB
VVEQITRLTENGVREIVLSGVDITSYGADLPGCPTLGRLVHQILDRVPSLPRLRLSSIDSIEADGLLVEAITTEPRVMPHLHLSLQSGDDLILKRMKRRHSRQNSIGFCAHLRAARPDIAFGADFIVGFPTETEAMFENTMKLVDECGLSFLHVFPFSPRPATPASRMPQVTGERIRARARRLRAEGAKRLAEHLAGQTGKILDVLVEAGTEARAPDFSHVRLTRPMATGALVRARVTGTEPDRLIAEPL